MPKSYPIFVITGPRLKYARRPGFNALCNGSKCDTPTLATSPLQALRAAIVCSQSLPRMSTAYQDAGTSPERLIEVHGTIRQVRCLTCDHRTPMGKTLERVRAGEADPACKACGGILKSDTISFGQSLNPETIRRASDAVAECDCLLAVGTSLQVYPIAGLVPQAVKTGASLLIVNQQATPMDHLASVVLHESISEVLPFLLSKE